MMTTTMTKTNGTGLRHKVSGSSQKTSYIVEMTTDYSMFKEMKGNRAKNSAHIKRLVDSMQEAYLLCPILVNEKYEIVDGQHRFDAIQQLSLPVYFIMVPGYGQKEVHILNSNSTNWSRKDFLSAYCDLGKQPYLTVRNFMRQFPEIGIQPVLMLLTGDKSGSKQKSTKGASLRTKDFEEGKLQINDLEYAERTAKKIMEIKPFYKDFSRFVFIQAMASVMKHPNYKHKDFLGKLEKRPGALHNCVTVEEYKILIEDIYNWRRVDKVNLRY